MHTYRVSLWLLPSGDRGARCMFLGSAQHCTDKNGFPPTLHCEIQLCCSVGAKDKSGTRVRDGGERTGDVLSGVCVCAVL